MGLVKPVCNCPDAANKRKANPGSDYISMAIPSDWSENFDGIRARGGYCIHELAVLRIRGDMKKAFPDGTPKDIRSPDLIKLLENRTRTRMQNPSTLGDSFE